MNELANHNLLYFCFTTQTWILYYQTITPEHVDQLVYLHKTVQLSEFYVIIIIAFQKVPTVKDFISLF